MKKLKVAIFGLLLLASCSTTPKIDWQSRISNYTYDQAVLEYGPPDKTATLTDGTRVSEWLTYRGHNTGGNYIIGRRGFVNVIGDYSPDYFLRLTFDANGKLQAVKKYAK